MQYEAKTTTKNVQHNCTKKTLSIDGKMVACSIAFHLKFTWKNPKNQRQLTIGCPLWSTNKA